MNEERNRNLNAEEWKQWVEDVNIDQGRRIEVLEDQVSNLEIELHNLYQWCRDAGIQMPLHSAVAELNGLRKRGWLNK